VEIGKGDKSLLKRGLIHYGRIRRTGYGKVLKTLSAGLIIVALVLAVGWAIKHGGSRQLVHLLLKQEFPLEVILLEGAPGLSAPERQIVVQTRKQAVTMGMYLLTGVNISDHRTFFLSFFSPPPNGPERISWAYSPKDPEFEGPVLDPLPPQLPPQDPPNRRFDSEEILVGIYHTHNSESYTGDGGEDHAKDGQGEILKIGEVIAAKLNENGIRTVHSRTDHEQGDFNTAYSRSYETVMALLEQYPSMQLLFDIHRDGRVPGMAKSTVKVNGRDSAQIMIVIGQKNPDWEKNEQFAQELIALAENKYPGLIRTKVYHAADARYNQHLTQWALLLEIGSQLNTLEEAVVAAEAFADVLTDWVMERIERQAAKQDEVSNAHSGPLAGNSSGAREHPAD